MIFGPKCKFIRCCTIDVGPEGTQIHAVYDTHLTDRKLRGFSKARKRTDVMAVLFFFQIWHSRHLKIQFEKSPRSEFARMVVFCVSLAAAACCTKLLISFYRIVLFYCANCIHSCKCRIFNLINIFLELLLFTFRSHSNSGIDNIDLSSQFSIHGSFVYSRCLTFTAENITKFSK